jgi:hypothetical protein
MVAQFGPEPRVPTWGYSRASDFQAPKTAPVSDILDWREKPKALVQNAERRQRGSQKLQDNRYGNYGLPVVAQFQNM